jgi:hypothetical protein
MLCPFCRASLKQGAKFCAHCKGQVRPDEHPALEMFRQYPWLAPLLAFSMGMTIWAATRRAPADEPIPPAAAPVEAEPAPASDPDAFTPPAPAPVFAPPAAPDDGGGPPRHAPRGEPSIENPPFGVMRPDGSTEPGPGAPRRGGPNSPP